ncbi:MAG: DUF308 domain-containing protein [Lachnospiraceae bacterium]|nr:DUF308 domain-containing protein [Lachnospiraceae bacterium]
MGKQPDTEENSRAPMNPRGKFGISVLVALYLMYLGYNLISSILKSEEIGMPVWVAVLFGALFIGFGVFYIVLSYRVYKNAIADAEAAEAAIADACTEPERLGEDVPEETDLFAASEETRKAAAPKENPFEMQNPFEGK